MNRLYVVETMPTSTGAKADHRLALTPSALQRFDTPGTLALVRALDHPHGPETHTTNLVTVDADGNPRIEFLDATGHVVQRLPAKK